MIKFSSDIHIIGVNPYVLLPEGALNALFRQAGKDKGPIPVHGTLNGHAFIQTLVKYAGKWRLYLNTPMRNAAGIDVGDTAHVELTYDPRPRTLTMHPQLQKALAKNKKAKAAYDALPPSRQKEIIRYIGFLKSEESVTRNVDRAVRFLLGEERFIGRDKA